MSRNLGKSVEKEAVISDEAIHSFRRILGAKKQEKESVEKEEIAEVRLKNKIFLTAL